MKKKAVMMAMSLIMTMMAAPLGVQAAPELMQDGTVFDAEYYAESNPDVTSVFGTDRDALYTHYLLCGQSEGRLACAADSEVFDPVYYAGKYPDIAAALGTDALTLKLHYELIGYAEGRYANAEAEAAVKKEEQTQTTSSDVRMANARQLVALVNQERAEHNIPVLEWSNVLVNSAFVRAQELSAKNSHVRPDGRQWDTVFSDDGLWLSSSAECIILGVATAEEAFRYFLRTESDKNIMLSRDYSKIIAGYDSAQGGAWVLILAK